MNSVSVAVGANDPHVESVRKQRLWIDFVESRGFPAGLTIRLQDFERDLALERTGAVRWLAEFEAYQDLRDLS